MLVYCGQTVGWIRMPLWVEVGLGPGHIVLDGDPASPRKGAQHPHFSASVCCGQTAGWIRISLGMEVGLGPGNIMLDGAQNHPHTLFGPLCSSTVAHLSNCWLLFVDDWGHLCPKTLCMKNIQHSKNRLHYVSFCVFIKTVCSMLKFYSGEIIFIKQTVYVFSLWCKYLTLYVLFSNLFLLCMLW